MNKGSFRHFDILYTEFLIQTMRSNQLSHIIKREFWFSFYLYIYLFKKGKKHDDTPLLKKTRMKMKFFFLKKLNDNIYRSLNSNITNAHPML